MQDRGRKEGIVRYLWKYACCKDLQQTRLPAGTIAYNDQLLLHGSSCHRELLYSYTSRRAMWCYHVFSQIDCLTPARNMQMPYGGVFGVRTKHVVLQPVCNPKPSQIYQRLFSFVSPFLSFLFFFPFLKCISKETFRMLCLHHQEVKMDSARGCVRVCVCTRGGEYLSECLSEWKS